MAELEKKWYVIRTITGSEKKVKQNIESEIELSYLKDFVSRVLVPTEKTYQIKNGKKVSKEVTRFPGYIYVEALMLEKVISVLQNVPGVLGFVGCKKKTDPPVAIRPDEVKRILTDIDDFAGEDEKFVPMFSVGEEVKIIDGPFNSFNGIIEEINNEKMTLKITVKIFGRSAPVELKFLQVEKA
ncbi:MAG: transcription termination/antitermination protein NusG [Bacteroidales bacterium]|nr:transcription termination/antitermination protein NusG [Bacteroidales bacterium]